MKRNTILFFLPILISTALFGRTIQLKHFDQLMNALEKGEMVRVIVHYGDCDLYIAGDKQESSPDAIGGMTIDTFEWFARGLYGNTEAFVVASENKLIANPQGEGYVYNYAKIKVWESGRVKVTAQYISADSLATTMDEYFLSRINNGRNTGAVYFYKVK